jgi:DNA-binding transcriptional regulator LsrR (DeoR family)
VQKALQIARAMTVGYISIGELSETSLLRRQDMITAEEMAELRAVGAVGDTNGMFFDAAGRAVDHPLNRRTLAVGFDDLRRCNVVALVAGVAKLRAARAFLASGVARGLIVDGDTALQIVADEGLQSAAG